MSRGERRPTGHPSHGKERAHKTLQDLVAHHKTSPVQTSTYSTRLTQPCPTSGPRDDLQELAARRSSFSSSTRRSTQPAAQSSTASNSSRGHGAGAGLHKEAWFAGSTSRQQVESLLNHRPDGTFMIRERDTSPVRAAGRVGPAHAHAASNARAPHVTTTCPTVPCSERCQSAVEIATAAVPMWCVPRVLCLALANGGLVTDAAAAVHYPLGSALPLTA